MNYRRVSSPSPSPSLTPSESTVLQRSLLLRFSSIIVALPSLEGNHFLVHRDIHCLPVRSMKMGDHVPQWRDFHSATNLHGRMYVFGGRFDRTGPQQTHENIYDNRLYVFDPEDHSWSFVPTNGQIPCGRRSHSACSSSLFVRSFVRPFSALQLFIMRNCTSLVDSTTSWDFILTISTNSIL